MRVLAVGCHPDDIECNCAGTIARLAAEGHDVYMCHVANGNMGHVEIMPEELGKIREKEAEDAGAVLGAKKVYNLDIGDCTVRAHDMNTVREMVRIIREVKPDFIISHDPNDYMEDHREVGRLVFDASFTASVPHMFPEYPAHSLIPPLYFMENFAGLSFEPEEYVDITDYIDLKIKALNCHVSQIKWMTEHDHIDFAEQIRSCSRFRGIQSGVKYAEGFRVCRTHPRQTTKRFLP